MFWVYLLFPITFFLSRKNHSKYFSYLTLLLYTFNTLLLVFHFPTYSILDISGLRLDSSTYLSLLSSVILLLLLYLGNILSLAFASNLKTNPTPSIISNSVCVSILFNNCLLTSCLFSGWQIYIAILISSLISSLSQTRLLKWNLASVQFILTKFFESIFQGFVLIMTGSSLASWFISICSALLSYPYYTETPKKNRSVEILHFFSVILFGFLISRVLNPYLYSGIFYKLHAEFHFI